MCAGPGLLLVHHIRNEDESKQANESRNDDGDDSVVCRGRKQESADNHKNREQTSAVRQTRRRCGAADVSYQNGGTELKMK